MLAFYKHPREDAWLSHRILLTNTKPRVIFEIMNSRLSVQVRLGYLYTGIIYMPLWPLWIYWLPSKKLAHLYAKTWKYHIEIMYAFFFIFFLPSQDYTIKYILLSNYGLFHYKHCVQNRERTISTKLYRVRTP